MEWSKANHGASTVALTGGTLQICRKHILFLQPPNLHQSMEHTEMVRPFCQKTKELHIVLVELPENLGSL